MQKSDESIDNKYAVIDVGTNNILMLLARKTGKQIDVVHRSFNISSLGKNMKNGLLNQRAIQRTKNFLKDYLDFARLFTQNIIVVGTSCSREALNINQLSDWLMHNFKLHYHIISGEQEAHFIGLANVREFSDFPEIILFDIGGGSSEFVYISKGEIIFTQSLPLGIRRLHNNSARNAGKRLDLTRKILQNLKDNLFTDPILIGTGSTATSLVTIKKQMRDYDSRIIHQSIINRDELSDLIKKIKDLKPKQIASLVPFDPLRIDIVQTGAMIIKEIIDHFNRDEFLVSDKGLAFGVLEQTDQEIRKYL
ncbi:MAG: hypothetical protein JW996_07385 [Candidatus Cloacimonetes bacterium]|nr:hypothetical protein [Candidatus Cloacimonadota bacterium]